MNFQALNKTNYKDLIQSPLFLFYFRTIKGENKFFAKIIVKLNHGFIIALRSDNIFILTHSLFNHLLQPAKILFVHQKGEIIMVLLYCY